MQEAWQLIKKAEAKQEGLPEGTEVSPEIVNLSLEAFKKYKGLAALAQYHGDTSLSVFATRRQAAAISMALEYNEKGVDPRHDRVVVEAEAFIVSVEGRTAGIQIVDTNAVEAAQRHLAKAAILHAGFNILLQLDAALPESWKIKRANIDKLADKIAREFIFAENSLADTVEYSLLAKVLFSAVVWFDSVIGVYKERKNVQKMSEYTGMAVYFSGRASDAYDKLIEKSRDGLEKAKHLIFKAQVLYWKANILWRQRLNQNKGEINTAYKDAGHAIDEALKLIRADAAADASNLLRHALVVQYAIVRQVSSLQDKAGGEKAYSKELEALFDDERRKEMLKDADLSNPYDLDLVANVLQVESGADVMERLLADDPEVKDRLRQMGADDAVINSLAESARRNLGESNIKEWRRHATIVK
ncbi:MAG: hypothetical protein HYU98_05810 [Deltaproteobacteria bacterium]|nr:hypothetical protein [Deltaproteobacteria bacterium]